MKYGKAIVILLTAALLSSCTVRQQPSDQPDEAEKAPAVPAVSDTTEPVPEPVEPGTTLHGEVTKDTWTTGTMEQRRYVLDNGDTVAFSTFTVGMPIADSAGVFTVAIPSDSVLRYVEPGGSQWVEQPTAPGTYSATLLMVDGTETYLMAYVPQAWERMEHQARRYVGLGTVQITETAEGMQLTLAAPAMATGCCADFTVVQSAEPLVDWSHPTIPSLWATYHNYGSGRWCYDGYYWPAYDNYIPTGEQVYFSMTDAYLCNSMLALANHNRLGRDLGACMLDVMAQRQNEYGFFPTPSGSEWLLGDYNIGPGFYDTRFNADLMLMFIRGWDLYGYDQFRDAMERYADFFLQYAAEHGRDTASGGRLVDDYYHPDGNLPTHTSLNHQLAQILLFYKLGETLERTELTDLADRMLQGVVDTESQWVRSDSNLHYAVYSDGSYGGNDYPYLTYNDLFKLNQYLVERTGQSNEVLQRLMAAKKVWMDANGVTGYLQQ